MKRSLKADPSRWSAKSRQTLALMFKKEYTDIEYFCWRCGTRAVFTAEDQRHSFEVKQNHVDQQRILCRDCWRESNAIRKELASFQSRWGSSKASLRKDNTFLKQWLETLARLEQYVPYRSDTAKKNMLTKLISRNA